MNKIFLILVLSISCTSAAASIPFQKAQQVYYKMAKMLNVRVNLYYSGSMNSNAWAQSNGIWVNQGMLNDVQNEDQLAMILGHELAHYINRDYNRKNAANLELQADLKGYGYCRAAGYTRCLSILYRLQSMYGNRSTDKVHPNWDVRIKYVKSGGKL